MLSTFAKYASYVPMPTIYQTTAFGTAALSVHSVFGRYNRWDADDVCADSTTKTIKKITKSTHFLIGKALLASLLAISQKQFPVLSRTGIVLLTPFVLRDCLSVCTWTHKEPLKTGQLKSVLALLGVGGNLLATGSLAYQNRSFPNFLHFIINAANVAWLLKPNYIMTKPSNRSP